MEIGLILAILRLVKEHPELIKLAIELIEKLASIAPIPAVVEDKVG